MLLHHYGNGAVCINSRYGNNYLADKCPNFRSMSILIILCPIQPRLKKRKEEVIARLVCLWQGKITVIRSFFIAQSAFFLNILFVTANKCVGAFVGSWMDGWRKTHSLCESCIYFLPFSGSLCLSLKHIPGYLLCVNTCAEFQP